VRGKGPGSWSGEDTNSVIKTRSNGVIADGRGGIRALTPGQDQPQGGALPKDGKRAGQEGRESKDETPADAEGELAATATTSPQMLLGDAGRP